MNEQALDTAQYFFRTVVFAKRGQEVSLVDLNNTKEETPPLDPWLGIVVMLADGQHTLQQLIEYLATRYTGSQPGNMEGTLESALDRLMEADIIKLSEGPIGLAYYLSLPADKLDIELARKLMVDDGYDHLAGTAEK